MTLRPAFIAASLLAVVTAGAVTTLTQATHHAAKADEQVCIVLAKDAAHQHTQYYCVDVGNAVK